MISGLAVYQQLQSSLDECRASALREQQTVVGLESQVNELIAQKGNALLELAKYYLPEINRPTVESTFTEIRASLLEILGRKERTRAELTARAERFLISGTVLEQKLEAVTAALNEHVRRRAQLEASVADFLKGDTEFQHLSQAAAQMEARLQQNEARVKELQASAAEKLPAYESGELFQYLYRRGFATANYRVHRMTRSFDRWVARLIDFPKAQRGYEFLKTTPSLMAEEVLKRKSEFKSLMEQIEAIEDRQHDAIGLTAVLAEGQRCGTERDVIVAALEASRHEQQAVETELRQLDLSEGQFYDEALQRFQQFLNQTETNVLQARAARTPDAGDDHIVSRVAELTSQIDQQKPQIAQAMLQRKRADESAAGMELVVSRFRQNNFDSERSSFAAQLSVADELRRYQQGLTKPEELWQVIRRQQQFEPTWVETAANQGAQVALQVLSRPQVSQALVSATIQVLGGTLNSLGQSGIARRAPERQRHQETQGRPPSGGRFTTSEGF